LQQNNRKNQHLNDLMIAGTPNSGKKVATAVATLLLMLILITMVLAARKRTAPAKEPPLRQPTATPR
jgi:hypothetical protein